MNKALYLLVIMLPLSSIANDSPWTTVRINEDLIASFPGKVDSMINFKGGPYTFNMYSGNVLSNLYMIQVTPGKAGLSIYDSISYDKALDQVTKGIIQRFQEKSVMPLLGDTVMYGIKMKTIVTDAFRIGTSARFYFFILNDRMYQIGGVQGNRDTSDASELRQFLNSVRVTGNIQENMFSTPRDAKAYQLGKIVGSLVFLGLVGGVIYFVVRAVSN